MPKRSPAASMTTPHAGDAPSAPEKEQGVGGRAGLAFLALDYPKHRAVIVGAARAGRTKETPRRIGDQTAPRTLSVGAIEADENGLRVGVTAPHGDEFEHLAIAV